MRILSTIEIYAGGPGSGPNAPCPQCGPKDKSTESGEKFKGPKGGPSPAPHSDVGFQPVSGQKPSGASKLYEKYLTKQKENVGSLKKYLTAPSSKPGTDIHEGDRVKFTPDHKVTSTGGGKYQFDNDTVAKVISVMPRVGNAPQMLGVQSEKDQDQGKFGNVGYVRADQTILHEARHSENPYAPVSKMTKGGNFTPAFDKYGKVIAPDPNAIQVKSVPQSQAIMHTTTNDGASLTWVKPHSEKESEGKSTEQQMKELSGERHSLKGQFSLQTTVPQYGNVVSNKTTRLYDTAKTGEENKGTTVWVQGITKGGKITGVNIREQNYSKYGQVAEAAYHFRYKNSAAAVGMLKSRYGITTSLKRLRGGG